jgi:curved DNA-binding protein CbpA
MTQDADGSSLNKGAIEGETADYYEILQLSRNAHPETIQRVFRMLAARYHPDNQETGDPDVFREVVEAARVLSDPQLRAAYDARLGVENQNRFKIFETWKTSRGVEAEKRKRKGILALLYGRRMTDTHQPSLNLPNLEEMLGVPREHLEFSLWFLRESKLIKRSDNNRFEITCEGVLVAEEEETHPFGRPVAQLSAPKEKAS